MTTKALVNYVYITLFFLLFTLFSFTSFNAFHPQFSWHDQQRIGQILLLIFASMGVLFINFKSIPGWVFYSIIIILAIGVASSSLAVWKFWAIKEWARYVGLFMLCLMMRDCANKAWFEMGVLIILVLMSTLHSFQFLIFYISAFVSGIYMLEPDLLFNGFSNPRFFGQFQVVLLPILACLALRIKKNNLTIFALLSFVLIVEYCISFALAGRGLWLGLLVSHAVLILTTRKYRDFVALQVVSASLGFVLFLILFSAIPAWLGIDPSLRDGFRTSISGRGQLWLDAWEMALANPWVGAGPMHYSAVYNPVAAHPHQVVLQWAAEWGAPATIIAIAIGIWGMLTKLFGLRYEYDDVGAALWLSIAGALVLAQVDGVFVMPYIETWLAILIGLAMARSEMKRKDASLRQRIPIISLAFITILCLGAVLINDVPSLPADSEAHMQKHQTGWTPRFWLQGWIPMDGVEGS